MGFVRRNRRFGGCLALAALALQIVLSFGHVHLDGVHRASLGAAVAGSTAQAAPSVPAQSPGHDADDYCALCASIFLVSTSFVPEPPQLPLPVGLERAERLLGVTFGVVIEPRRLAFQSRAPPFA